MCLKNSNLQNCYSKSPEQHCVIPDREKVVTVKIIDIATILNV